MDEAGAPPLRCPCCASASLSEEGAYEICPACGWEDDPVQRADPDYAGGANAPSLNQARQAWLAARSRDGSS
ncbi:CPCC family cysteine-rich protein [Labrys wisconsinensis]|uniref:Anaerobic ribonucleoside-triphosphate reductase n=1 Tax=Labrys wisconsinensis TaxID=425677 RepID=A0ABU0JDS6_9HYPH|nr:CPCC family cysteine-rich protein [Labrys wisconsinensis]MDQ0472436.1 anaerobic ribonucleoside-triphosphate reductase [Labrys wisconsinensis]